MYLSGISTFIFGVNGFAVCFSAVFFLFTLWVSTTVWGKGRFEQISLFGSEEIAKQISIHNQALAFDEGQNNITVALIFNNKVTGYARVFLQQYMGYFSPGFLLLEGGFPYRYSVPDDGLIFFGFALLILFSLLPLQIPIRSGIFVYMLYLLLIAPLSGALTIDDTPNMHRVLAMIIPLMVLTTMGALKLEKLLAKSNSMKVGPKRI